MNQPLLGVLIILFIHFSCTEKQEYHEDQIVDETRFSKVRLAGDLDEPMEIAITPEGNVVIVERKGAVKYYEKNRNQTSLIHTFNVFFGLEDGLLGVALDPQYKDNNFIYFFYSPAGEREVQRVSRFVLDGNSLDTLSEKILIEIPTQRKECCHSAGSLAFGPDGNLFIAVGDNTNPHNPGYYNSIDERKGREYWDAQRTAGNTNDLRGKILRIHPEPDGSYTIPEGNLFQEGDSLARPEIYVMGCRNPYRISVDAKRKWLFWGDVGQNTIDNPARGPISYDEWHVAREAGFFGWPYFAGPNAPYADFDFETNEIGPFFDVEKPVNRSVNNTGLQDLPPAKGAMIWYSYDESKEFDHLGTGGKSPIAGPVYYADLYNKEVRTDTSVSLPAYYNGKLFIAEWLRDWINVVTLNDDGTVKSIEPFMRKTGFSHPIELEIGPEGALYVLDYGVNWFSKNPDAALYRIEYARGNRSPVVKVTADPAVGAAPLSVKFSTGGTFDPDSGDTVTYEWYFDKDEPQSTDANPTYTFQEKGIYTVKLVATDENGKQTTTTTEVRAGNALPEVSLEIDGNRSFYRDNKPIRYTVDVHDAEDGSLGDGIREADVSVNLTYSTMGTDMTLVEQSEETFTSSATGWQLMKESDCKACHAINDKSVGPSYLQIAARYPNEKANVEKLSSKIISGGSGSWGENVMSAHPQLSQQQAEEMVSFILSLRDDAQATRPLPVKGSFSPDSHLKDKTTGDYILTVSFKDKPVGMVGSNQVRKRIVFRHPVLNALSAGGEKGVTKSVRTVAFNEDGAWIMFPSVDLTGIKSIRLLTSSQLLGGKLTLRIDSPDGAEIGTVSIERDPRKPKKNAEGVTEYQWQSNLLSLKEEEGIHDIYVVFDDEAGRPDEENRLLLRSLEVVF